MAHRLAAMTVRAGDHGDLDVEPLAPFLEAAARAMGIDQLRLIARMLERPRATPASVLALLEKQPLKELDDAAKGADHGVTATFQAVFEARDAALLDSLLNSLDGESP